MTSRFTPLTSIAAALSLGLTVSAQALAGPSAADLAQADALIENWVSDTAPGVSVAVSMNDEIVVLKGAGMANLEQGLPITPDSVFLVASVSKQFTAFAIALLASEGQVDLDADIRAYIPELHPHPQAVTVRDLLDHTGGLRESGSLASMAGWLEDDIRDPSRDLELIVRQQGVNFAAGARVEYNNTGYALLAEIVARVSGQSFPAFMQARVFSPLGMTQSRFPASRNDLIMGRATAYYPSQDGFKTVIAANETAGSTGLYTTPQDLLKWAENFETQTVGTPEVFEIMAERRQALNGEDAVFAKGQELRPYLGFDTWSHGGRDAGFRSFLLRVPEADLELSLVSNRTDFDSAALAFALMEIFVDDHPDYAPLEPASWSAAGPDELAQYAGDYELQPGMIFTIAVTETGLTFAPLGAPPQTAQALPQTGPRQFLLNPATDISLVFPAPGDQPTDYFDYTIGLHGAIRGHRVALAAFDPETVDLQPFAGVYDSEELGTSYTITVEDGVLVADHMRRPADRFTPYQTDTFSSMQGGLRKLAFQRDEHGQVTGFLGSAPLVENVRFVRRADAS